LEKPPEVVDRSDGRLALKRAQAELSAAQAELTKCSAALAACNGFVRQWIGDIARADAAAGDHARRNAELIADGQAPEVDESLSQIRSKAVAARADLIASRRHLESDEKAASAAVERAKIKINAEIEKIVTARAITEAAELAEMWQDVWRRYDRLTPFTEARFPRPNGSPANPGDPFASQRGGLQLITLPADVIQLIQTLAGLDHRWGRSTGKERNTVRLDAWRKGLLEDADAEL
jgi:hypothetical protein